MLTYLAACHPSARRYILHRVTTGVKMCLKHSCILAAVRYPPKHPALGSLRDRQRSSDGMGTALLPQALPTEPAFLSLWVKKIWNIPEGIILFL